MKKIVITGGAGGIGLAIAKLFKQKGFEVFTLDLKPLAEDVKVKHHLVDINNLDKVINILKEIGHFDVLVNNAAVQIEKPFLECSNEEIASVLQTNLLGTILFTKEAFKFLNTGGQIINIGSIHGNLPRKNKISYDVSKAGLEMFTKELALELAPCYRVNQVNFGAVLTPMNKGLNTNDEAYALAKSKVPLNHIFISEDIAKVVYNITTDDFKYMTGSILVYDAGRSLV